MTSAAAQFVEASHHALLVQVVYDSQHTALCSLVAEVGRGFSAFKAMTPKFVKSNFDASFVMRQLSVQGQCVLGDVPPASKLLLHYPGKWCAKRSAAAAKCGGLG